MSLVELMIIILALGSIIGAIMVLKKSAKKFDLSEEQLKKIKKRNEDLDREDRES